MKVKPKEVLINMPVVLMFDTNDEIVQFASTINMVLHGKVKVKYEELGKLNEKQVGFFYLQRNNESQELRDSFMELIENEEVGRMLSQHHSPMTVEEMADNDLLTYLDAIEFESKS